ncbi:MULTISPECIES: ABC transporter permease [unclassified Undibacterium]|uniref:ABC transporter permease n=1 Tax=unclassified Undibacterium TaxID=2630295 RepID=UPI002AC9323D|nr:MULTISPECIES: ABC transporter permease [unclassified Undibacterium]MEB0139416.1 ABC transporter permease [Undibacterium sp. CCC2.1]MEB0174055.1 ABC transporter permease [Undibacterium sp. CCC1.1]MEB0177446.1 ABC transporter permease [Undibacterium sp. CCC3.4]MEB0216617.1 ABC transporter permease [Undibacterium sp. 5I2]WPX44013.1 ABC transporter permease [Undibacterium sp. CCC3.4]
MKLPRLTIAAALALSILGAVLASALFAPLLAPYALNEVIGTSWDPPSAEALLGTDNLGRDLLSRLIWGARVTLLIAFVATALAFLIGGVSGFVAGLYRGKIDVVLNQVNDLLMAIPSLIVALVVLTIFPSSLTLIITVMAVLDSTRVFRISRSLVLDVTAMDYVEAAKLRGEGSASILWREVLPNVFAPLLAEFGLRLVFAILFLSTLSFLGLGVQPPSSDWGGLLKENKDGIVFGVWAALSPGIAIAVLAISINIVVDWWLDWTQRSSRGGQDV